MNINTININTVRPLVPEYRHDDHLKFSNNSIVTNQGLSLNVCDMLQDVTDHKINDGDMLTLTEKKTIRPDLNVYIPEVQNIYPYTFSTYLVYSENNVGSLTMYSSRDYRGAYPTRNNPQFVQIEESTNDEQDTRQYAITSTVAYEPLVSTTNIPNNQLFEVELIDDTNCRIMHDDGYVKTYLTYDDVSSPESSCSFSIAITGDIVPTHKQVFMYNIDNNYGYMGLAKNLTTGDRTFIIHTGESNTGGRTITSNGVLSGSLVEMTLDLSWPQKSIAKINQGSRVNASTSIARSVDTSWYNYKAWQDGRDVNVYRYEETSADADTFRYFDYNEVEPDENRTKHFASSNSSFYANSHVNLKNNFLIDCQYTNISGNKMFINVTPLKNQLTPQGELAENSPHATGNDGEFCINPGAKQSTDFRTYHKIFSGTNQNRGDDQLCLGYTAYTDQLTFKGDQISYFHMPHVMKPYTWMNINYRRVPDEYPVNYPTNLQVPIAASNSKGYDYEDFVGLLRAGAIAGSSPLNSDKIFKKRADYRFYSNWGDAGLPGNRGKEGDSHYGTWLCAWLRMTIDEKSERKFGPMWMDRYYDDTRFSEHQVMDKPLNCVEGGETGLIGRLNNIMVSHGYVDIPSELRLERGVLYAYHHLGTNNTRTIIKSFDKYMFHQDIDEYTTVLSGAEHPGVVSESDGYKQYEFSGTQFGRTKSPEPSHGDFRISMWMHSDDWSQPFGHQILGNYTNDGIAVENNAVITPLLITKNTDNITMMNTHGESITTIQQQQYTNDVADNTSSIFASRTKPVGDLSVVASKPNYIFINNFNMNGALADTHTISGGMMKRKGTVVDAHAVDDYMFTVFDNTSAAGRIDTQSGEFLDLDVTDFEVIRILSAGDIGRVEYNRYFTVDTSFELINDKPVYVGAGVSETFYMFNSGSSQDRWIFTENIAGVDGGDSVIDLIGYGTTPTTFESSHNPGVSGGTVDVMYGDYIPSTTYLTPANAPVSYSKIYYQDSKSLFMVDGTHVCGTPGYSTGGTNTLYYVNGTNIYAHNMSLVFTSVYNNMPPVIVGGDDVSTIDNIKTDKHNNIWVFYNNNNVAKYDHEYNLMFNMSLSGQIKSDSIRALSGEKMFDIIGQYSEHATYDHHAVLFHKNDESELMDVMNISTTGEVTFRDSVSANSITTSMMSAQSDMSNFGAIDKLHRTKHNSLTFKFRTKNKYDQTDFVDISETFDVSKLSRGWHHLSFGFDANLKGLAYFYIDGLLARETSVLSRSELGKYGFTDVLSKFTTVGATQGYNNELLNKLLKQPGYYHSKGFMIKSLRLYNFNLFRDYVKTLSREHLSDHEMVWNVPSGRKAHIDHVEKFHKHRLPGYKSADVSIDLMNTGLSGGAQQIIQSQLEQTIRETSPAISNITDINWVDHTETGSSEPPA